MIRHPRAKDTHQNANTPAEPMGFYPEQSLTMPTSLGPLEVVTHSDPSYPGFTLYWEGQQVGVFECNEPDKAVRLYVWVKDSENFTKRYTITKEKA